MPSCRPTIMRIRSSDLTDDVSTVATSRPSRKTVMRSAILKSSESL